MRDVSTELAEILSNATKRVAWAVEIEIPGGAVWRYTDWDQEVEIGGETFVPWPVHVRSLNLSDDPMMAKAGIELSAHATLAAAVDDLTLSGAVVRLYGLYGGSRLSPNLLTPDQASCEDGITGLEAWDCDRSPGDPRFPLLYRDASEAWQGEASACLENVNDLFEATAEQAVRTSPEPTPVVAGETYSGQVRARHNSNRILRVEIAWLDSIGDLISTTHGTNQQGTANWELFTVTGVAPVGAVDAYIGLSGFDVTRGQKIWWDGAQIEAGAAPSDWSMPGTLVEADLQPLLLFEGSVEVPSLSGGSAELRVGAGEVWSVEAPDLYLPTCRYHLASQCDLVSGCARTWAACTANNRRAIFGGFRHLPPDWLVIQYRDGSGVAGR